MLLIANCSHCGADSLRGYEDLSIPWQVYALNATHWNPLPQSLKGYGVLFTDIGDADAPNVSWYNSKKTF